MNPQTTMPIPHSFRQLKVALVHDWLTGMRGGEKCLEMFCELFPQADIYTLLWNKNSVSKTIEAHPIYTSFLQRMPFVKEKYRYYLPFMPFAISRFSLDTYDLVISSSHCVAKGIRIRKGVPHVCYCYTPMRYIWDQYNEYFNKDRSGTATRALMSVLRPHLQQWDIRSSKNVTSFIAISKNIQNKISSIYQRDSLIIYPPVDIHGYPESREGTYFLMVTALVPYKRVDIAISAFNELGYPLKIIGSGPDQERLKNFAKPNIEFLGWLSNEEIKDYYAGCKAFIFPQEEDFGITAIEAQAAGKPVIAFAQGGALETVLEKRTGIFFRHPSAESLKSAIHSFEKMRFDAHIIRDNAARFSQTAFKNEVLSFLLKTLSR